MSGPTGHEREPDRAALDELERAFADELDTAHGAEEDPETQSAAEATDPDQADGGGPTQPVSPGDRDSDDDVPNGELTDDSASDEHEDAAEHNADGSDTPGEILIVEAEPVVEPQTPTPKVIRIDDYSGSAAIDDGPDESVSSGLAARPVASQPTDRVDQHTEVDPVVIAIDDEDLPDAVYVEGSLDRSGSRSIVFIEDDDTGDTLKPEAERDIRRGIEPRMRERRVAVKRAKGRKRLKWVALVAAVVVLVVGALAVLGSGLFAIQEDQVFVTGNVYADPEMLQDVIDDLVGTPVLLADTQAAERQLEEISWVDTARVQTDFPHSVTIEIRERKAISTYRGPDLQFRVLDREGRVLDVIEKYPIAYVLLDGPDPVNLDVGEFAPRGYAAASELAKNLTGSVRGRVLRIEVTSDGSSLVMFLVDDVQVRFGEARDLFAKLVRLETVFSSGGAGDSDVIDVSTNEVTL